MRPGFLVHSRTIVGHEQSVARSIEDDLQLPGRVLRSSSQPVASVVHQIVQYLDKRGWAGDHVEVVPVNRGMNLVPLDEASVYGKRQIGGVAHTYRSRLLGAIHGLIRRKDSELVPERS